MQALLGTLLSYSVTSSDVGFELEGESKVNRTPRKSARDAAGHYEPFIHLFARERLVGRPIHCKNIRTPLLDGGSACVGMPVGFYDSGLTETL